MSDVRCWRCNAKLFVVDNATGSAMIKCDRCKAQNRVELSKGLATA